MRVPLAWLRDYVELPYSTTEIVERLALLGFPVEAVEERPHVSGVVIGKIAKLEKHPNADRLQVCTMDVGAAAPLVIATAATNVAEGQYVPVATIGAQLVGMKIEPRKMRGVDSQGMLCSANELGFPAEWFEDGILQLDPGSRIGSDFVQAFRLNDAVLEVDVTPNRPDALCMVGLARELAAAFGQTLKFPETTVAYGDEVVDALSGETKTFDSFDIRVTLESPDCRRFVVQRLSYLRVRTSKTWMRLRLALAGQRPINNAVDISNFVMLELGQPLHFYDYDRLAGKQLIVRDARPNEKIVTLDEADRTLDPSVLVIADTEQPQCLAGLKGAAASEVTPQTSELVIEAANFNGPRIRRMGIALNLRTDASARHEKNLPIALTDYGASRAARLLEQEGATIHMPRGIGRAAGIPPIIDLPVSEIPRLLGFSVSDAEIEEHLKPLGFELQTMLTEELMAFLSIDPADSDDVKSFEVTAPWWRSDVHIAADVIEEIARMVGYDRIEEVVPNVPPSDVSSEAYRRETALAQTLAALGYHETVNLALEPAAVRERLMRFGVTALPEPIEIQNPLSEDQRYMRFSLLPAFLALAARQRTQADLRIFEIGHIFRNEGEELREIEVAALAAFGPRRDEPAWRDSGFQALKSDAEALLRAVTGTHPTAVPTTSTGLHPGKTAALQIEGREVGVAGAIDPRALAAYGIEGAGYLAVFRLDALPTYRMPRYQAQSRFPAIERDLAVIVAPDVPARAVETTVREAVNGLVRGVHVFDDYRGPQIGAERKSLAVRITLQRDDATMTDVEADGAIATMLEALQTKLGATLRQ